MLLTKGMNRQRNSNSRQRRRTSASSKTLMRQLCVELLEDRRVLTVDFAQIGSALNSQLLGMQTQLTATLDSFQSGSNSSLPFVGEKLGSSAQIVTRFNSGLQSALAGLGTVVNPTETQIQNALANVPFLVDRNANGVGPEDVLVTRSGSLGSEGFAVQMRLQAGQTASPGSVSFDTGLPSLPLSLSASGTIEVSVGFAYELAFTYNANNQQVSLDSSKTLAGLVGPDGNHAIVDSAHPLAIFVSAGLSSGFSVEATLGFVQGTATPIANQANAFHITAMINNLGGTPTIKLDGVADANLRLSGGFAGTSEDFPGIDADFHLHWVFSSNDLSVTPQVAFDNVSLDLGEFLNNLLKPVFEVIQTTTAPMQPLEGLIRYPLPVLTDLSELVGGDPVTLLSIADVIAPYTDYGPLFDLIHSMSNLTNSINQFDLSSTLKMPLGGFNLNNYDLRGTPSAGDVHDLNLKNLTEFAIANVQATDLPIPSQATEFLQNLAAAALNGYEIKFPILDDPKSAVFGLLVGRDADLFTFKADYAFDSQADELPNFSVYGMGVVFEGDVHMEAHFKFSYDTFGLRQLVNHLADGNTSQIAEDIVAGFYIGSDSYVSLSGGLKAGVGARLGIVSLTLGGFVSTDNEGDEPVRISVDDPNHDGKLRFAEFQVGGLETSGLFEASLGLEVKVGVKVFGTFIGFKKRFDIASTIIVDLNVPDPNAPVIPTGPVMASQPDEDGIIELYVGASSHLRQNVSQVNGDDRIVIRNIESTNQGETIEIAMWQELVLGGDMPPIEYWATQTITGVKSIFGYADLGDLVIDVLPGVNVDVHFEGGDGRAEFMYNGAGSAYLQAGDEAAYLVGGSGFNTLFGGPSNDTLILGSGGNLTAGGLGDNSFVITTPLLDSGLVLGGSDEGNNTFVVLAGENTQWISAMPAADGSINLNYQIADAPVSPGLDLRQFSTLVISAQDRLTGITVGDLSPAGVSQVIISNPTTGAGGRNIVLDTRAAGGTSDIIVSPFVNAYFNNDDPQNAVLVVENELQVVNSTTGVTTYLLGMKAEDVTTIRQHGGSTHIGQLSKDEGSLAFDFSSRQLGAVQIVTMTTPALDTGNWITSHAENGDFVVNAINYPTLIFRGLSVADNIAMDVAAPTLVSGLNQVLLDASSLKGTMSVNFLGVATANNLVTVSKLAEDGSIAVQGGNTSTSAVFGTGRLALIRGDVSIQNATLTIDNASSLSSSFLTMTTTSFSGWDIPGIVGIPTLTYSDLHGVMTVHAGASDRFTLDGTPDSISSAVFDNASTSRDYIYMAAWTKPLTLNGDFSLYLGGRLVSGNLDRIKRLNGLANLAINMNYSSVIGGGSSVTLDGDLDPAGASYSIDGDGNMLATNQTLGLSVTINGFRDQDELRLHLPGGSLIADLVQTGRGAIYVDGSARSTGTNPNATNNITTTLRAGTHSLDPAGATDTVVHAFNIVYALGNLPQDDLTVRLTTATLVNNRFSADAGQLRGTLHLNALNPAVGVPTPFGLTTIVLAAVHPQLTAFVEGNDPFAGNSSYQADQTTFAFGSGNLARIQGNVTASHVVLKIDDSAATQPSDLLLASTEFRNWIIPSSSLRPVLSYNNLYRTLTIDAGAGDRVDLNQSPSGVSNLVLNNQTPTLDSVFTAVWTVPITLNGHVSFFAGQKLVVDDLNQEQIATIQRERRLGGVPVSVTLNYSGATASEVVLDGDIDSAGAQYIIDGTGNLRVVNQTVGLSVTINGYREQDELYIYMPGATVAANLQRTSPGTIYLDGTARLVGTNPTASNDIAIEARYGQTEMLPQGTNNSLLDMFNDVYLLNSMPQDQLTVNVPTNVRISASKTNTLSLDSLTNVFAVVNAARTDALITWKEGPSQSFTPFNSSSTYASNWTSPWPNPYTVPYGIDIPYEDAPLSVGYYSMSGNVVTENYVYSGVGRYYIVDPNPVAIDNEVRLDASQLRGNFQFKVAGPEFDYIEILASNSFQNFPTSYTYTGFHTWGGDYDHMRIAFGQSNIVLSHVHPELTVDVVSENSDFEYPAGTFPPNSGPEKQVVVSDYPVTALHVGEGVLANIQGDLSVQQVALTLDDSAGTSPNRILLNGTTITGWATTAGITHPVLTMSALENRPLTLIGSSLDRFGVENTPVTAGSTTISNLSTSGPHSAVYVMGKSPNQNLNIVGNLDLYVGQRLNSDGSVVAVGQVAGVLAPAVNRLTAQPINYDFTGLGNGQIVYDATNHVAGEIVSQSQSAIAPHPTESNRERLMFDQSYNAVVYNANTNVDLYGPTIAAQGFNPSAARISLLVDHRLPGTVRYFAGPTIPPHIVRVMASNGPLLIEGRGPLTRVEVDPTNVAFANFDSSFSQTFVSLGNDIAETILAEVTVTNANLMIRPDLSTTPAPASLKNILLTDTRVTGIAGAAINFVNLRDIVTTTSTAPGLLLQAPRQGASLTIVDTPNATTTGVHVIGSPLTDVSVLGTTGRLALGSISNLGQNANDFRLVASSQSINFAAQSLTIGDGTLQNIHGDVMLGRQDTFSTSQGIVIDNHNDLPRVVNASVGPSDGLPLNIQGIAPAAIRLRQASGGLSIYGSPASQFTLRGLDNSLAQSVSVYAGLGSSVELLQPNNGVGTFDYVPSVRVLGAATVHFVATASLSTYANSALRIEPDPARPNDLTHLIADYSSLALVTVVNVSAATKANIELGSTGIGMGQIALGDTTLTPHVRFDAATTQLALMGSNRSDFPSSTRIVDSGPRGNVIYPGRQPVKVLGTSGPLEIRQPLTPPFGTPVATVILGNAGNMQAILGDVTIIGDNAAFSTIPLRLDNSTDTFSHTVSISNPSANNTTISGLSPATIHVLGSFVNTTLLAGLGENSLRGPEAQNLWEINAINGGKLNAQLSYSGIASVVGGGLDDEFLIREGGLVGGSLDGGASYDVIRFDVYVLPEANTIDLPNGIVPRINGIVSNVEAVIAPFAIVPIANQNSTAGTTIVPLKVLGSGGLALVTYSATGLPAGLAIHPQTGFISGTISESAVSSSPHQVHVTANDGSQTASLNFQWSVVPNYSIVNPGTLIAPEGLPLNLLIHIDNPSNRSLTFTAFGNFGLPAYLNFTKIDDSTAAFQGTVYFYGGTYNWPITVYATDGFSTVSTSFQIQTLPGVGVYNPGSLTSYVGTNINLALVNNHYGHSLTISSSGLPAGVSINSSGLLSGTLAAESFNGSPYNVNVQLTDNTINYSYPFSFQWDVLAQFPASAFNPGDQTRYVGDNVFLPLDVENQFGHSISVGVSGLPSGVVFDANTYLISGTISATALLSSPHAVVISVIDHTLSQTTPTSFQWTVLPTLSLDDLNEGTAAGVPFLVHISDPQSGGNSSSLTPVTFNNLGNSSTLVYFLLNNQLWLYDGDLARLVESTDPEWTSFENPYSLMAIPNRGVLFQASGKMWLADQQGAKVVSTQAIYPTGTRAFTIGNSSYFTAYDAAFSFNQLWRVRFNAAGIPIIEPGASTEISAISEVTSFANGIAFVGTTSATNSPMSLYWLDGNSGTLTVVASSNWNSWPPAYSDLTLAIEPNGIQKLYFLENTLGGRLLRVIDSLTLVSLEPEPTTLVTYDPSHVLGRDSYPSQPLVAVGGKIVLSEFVADYSLSQFTTQYWVSDGTPAGTAEIGNSLDGYGLVFDPTSWDGAVYFVYHPTIENLPESMTIAQIWKVDPIANAVTEVVEVLTREVDGGSPIELLATAEKLYFNSWDSAANAMRLWFLNTNDEPVKVAAKADNKYRDPRLSDAVYGGGVLYFTALSEAVLQWNGQATPQLWALGPAVPHQIPGDLDGSGIVDGADIDQLYVLIGASNISGDLNGDALVNRSDVDYLIHNILRTEYGDVNLDGFVDAADLAIVRRNINVAAGQAKWAKGNMNGDAFIDAADLAIVRRNIGFSRSNSGGGPKKLNGNSGSTPPVPPPSLSTTQEAAKPTGSTKDELAKKSLPALERPHVLSIQSVIDIAISEIVSDSPSTKSSDDEAALLTNLAVSAIRGLALSRTRL